MELQTWASPRSKPDLSSRPDENLSGIRQRLAILGNRVSLCGVAGLAEAHNKRPRNRSQMPHRLCPNCLIQGRLLEGAVVEYGRCDQCGHVRFTTSQIHSPRPTKMSASAKIKPCARSDSARFREAPTSTH